MSAGIPKALYVTSKDVMESSLAENGEYVTTIHRLGFLHPHEPNKAADAKRKQTQLTWAESRHWRKPNTLNTYDPLIWENTPITGFEILKTITRWSTSNKVFRIMDPRGIEFEISAESFFNIAAHGTIKNGVIQDPCVWKSNKVLIIAKD